MKEEEIITRLVRVESKLDSVLPHVEKVSGLERDISVVKKIIGIISSIVALAGTWAATYFGSKH